MPASKKSSVSKKRIAKGTPKPKGAAKASNTPAKRQEAILRELRSFGLAYPGAHRKSPWPGHDDLAVNDKTFTYLSAGEPFSMSCKLPFTAQEALKLPSTSPAAYGLGRSGWVTGRWSEKDMPPLDVLKDWIDESYRAQAPKKLAAQAPYWRTKKG